MLSQASEKTPAAKRRGLPVEINGTRKEIKEP